MDPESRLAEVGLLDAEIGTLKADNRSLRAVNKVLAQDNKDLETEIEKLQTITPTKSAKAKNSEHASIVNLSAIIGEIYFYSRRDTESFNNRIIEGLKASKVVNNTTTHRRNIYLLLSIIIYKYSVLADIWGNDFDNTRKLLLHSKNDFESVISSKFLPEYKKILKKLGIIDYSSSYLAGSHSKNYWIKTNDWFDFIPVTLDQLGLPNFSKPRTNKLLRYFYKLDNFHFTTETEQFLWGNLFQLKFDSAANDFIDEDGKKPLKRQIFSPSKVKRKCGKCGKRVGRTKRKCPKCKSNNIVALPDIDQRAIARHKVGRISAKQFTFQAPSLKMDIEGDGFFVDEKIQCRRIFTSVTSTKRELREFLRYNNKPLCEVDIHASQPLIAMSLYSGDYYSAGQGKRVRFSLPLAPLLVIVREPCWTDTGTTRIKNELKRWRDLYPSQQSDKDFYDNFAALAGEKFNRETVKALIDEMREDEYWWNEYTESDYPDYEEIDIGKWADKCDTAELIDFLNENVCADSELSCAAHHY